MCSQRLVILQFPTLDRNNKNNKKLAFHNDRVCVPLTTIFGLFCRTFLCKCRKASETVQRTA